MSTWLVVLAGLVAIGYLFLEGYSLSYDPVQFFEIGAIEQPNVQLVLTLVEETLVEAH
jgi:hypothetical protein